MLHLTRPFVRRSMVFVTTLLFGAGLHALASPGSLDTTFGSNGTYINDLGGTETGGIVMVLPDGKLLLGGSNAGAHSGLSFTRLNDNGTLDTSYGSGGTAYTDSVGMGGVHRLEDGQLLVTTSRFSGSLTALNDFGLMRFSANGVRDTSFGTNGMAYVKMIEPDTYNESATAVAVQSDGKIILAGWITRTPTDWDIGVARFTADGQLDTTFGTNGRVVIDSNNGNDRPAQVVILPDDSILISGQLRETDQSFLAAAIIKLTPDGALDTDFGDNGMARLRTDVNDDTGGSLRVLRTGKLLLAINGTARYTVARYHANGAIDTTFGNNGLATVMPELDGTSFPGFGSSTVLIQPNDRIVIAGNVSGLTPTYEILHRASAVRLNADGSLDTTFGDNGHAIFHPFEDGAGIPSMISGTIDLEGRLIFAGYIPKGDDDRWVVRIIGDGNEPPPLENTPPVANNDTYTSPKNSILTVAAPGVLGNDEDADGHPLTASLLTPPANGDLVLNADGSFTYTPDADYVGDDSFTYQAADAEDTSEAATVTLSVTDTLPTLSSANRTASESATALVFTVTLSAPLTVAVSVDYATGGGDATPGIDYVATNGTLTFAPGESEKTIQVMLIDDEIDEDDENLVLTLSSPANATLETTSYTGTILDDDALEISIADVTVDENPVAAAVDGPNLAEFQVTLNRASAHAVTIAYATGGGNATPGEDYTATSGNLSFAAGETAKTIPVTILNDETVEGTETFDVILSNPSRGTLVRAVGSATISDDDVPNLSIGNASVPEGDSGTVTAIFTVTLSEPSPLAVTVQYQTADGSATAGSDYAATSGTLTFPASVTEQTIAIDVFGDELAEGDETFTVVLSNPTNANLANATGNGEIVDDDAPWLRLAVAPSSFSEAAGPNAAVGTITRNTTEALTITLVSDDTTEATVPANVQFAIDQLSATFAIAAEDDQLIDGPQNVTITASASGYTAGSATVTVIDNERAANLVYKMVALGRGTVDGQRRIDRGNGYLLIDLELNRAALLLDTTQADQQELAFEHGPGWYTIDEGRRQRWMLTNEAEPKVAVTDGADSIDYLELSGLLPPRERPIGSEVQYLYPNLFAGRRLLIDEPSASIFDYRLTARFDRRATIQANEANDAFETLLDGFRDQLGLTPAALTEVEAVEDKAVEKMEDVDGIETAATEDLIVYLLTYRMIETGAGGRELFAARGYAVREISTGDTVLIRAYRQGRDLVYDTQVLTADTEVGFTTTARNRRSGVVGLRSSLEDGFQLMVLQSLYREMPLTSDPRNRTEIPFRFMGDFVEHTDLGGGDGLYGDGTIRQTFSRRDTREVNEAELSLQDAVTWLIQNRLEPRYQPVDR